MVSFITENYQSPNRFLYNRWQRRMCTLYIHTVQLYSDVTSVNSVFVSDKMINNSDNFRVKWLSYSKISAILCVPYFLFLHFIWFWKTCQLMWGNFVFLVIFDTCDVVYNWSISLLLVSELFTFKIDGDIIENQKCLNVLYFRKF